MKTQVGSTELRVPRVRDGSFSPELFCRYKRSEQALVLALMDMVVNDASDYEEAVRDKLFQVNRIRIVQGTGFGR